MCAGGEDRMFREIRGIEDERILSAIHRLPPFYFQGGWADEIGMELFRLPACGRAACAGSAFGRRFICSGHWEYCGRMGERPR